MKLLLPTPDELCAAALEATLRVQKAALTQNQVDLMALKARGLRDRELGHHAGVSEKAAGKTVRRVVAALDASTSYEALAILVRAGLL